MLPTSGYARVFSGLNVDYFTKKISVQMITDEGLLGLEETITTLAEAEGLKAHAESVRRRLEPREGRNKVRQNFFIYYICGHGQKNDLLCQKRLRHVSAGSSHLTIIAGLSSLIDP